MIEIYATSLRKKMRYVSFMCSAGFSWGGGDDDGHDEDSRVRLNGFFFVRYSSAALFVADGVLRDLPERVQLSLQPLGPCNGWCGCFKGGCFSFHCTDGNRCSARLMGRV